LLNGGQITSIAVIFYPVAGAGAARRALKQHKIGGPEALASVFIPHAIRNR
jgi:hypothetical protein